MKYQKSCLTILDLKSLIQTLKNPNQDGWQHEGSKQRTVHESKLHQFLKSASWNLSAARVKITKLKFSENIFYLWPRKIFAVPSSYLQVTRYIITKILTSDTHDVIFKKYLLRCSLQKHKLFHFSSMHRSLGRRLRWDQPQHVQYSIIKMLIQLFWRKRDDSRESKVFGIDAVYSDLNLSFSSGQYLSCTS